MLSKRLANDGIPSVHMSDVQLQAKAEVEKKIADKVYQLEDKDCLFCSGNQLELLSEKDFHGLYTSVKICRDCGLVQQTPRMTPESLEQFYNNEYRRLEGSDDIGMDSYFKEQYAAGTHLLKTFTKHGLLKKSPGETHVLDVGCAAGGILKPFHENGYCARGIDIGGEEYLKYGINTHGLKLEQASLDTVKLEQKQDVIILSHVVEHFLDPLAELQKLRNILADDGFLYIEVPGIKWIFNNKFNGGDLLKYIQNAHVCHFSFRTICNMLLKSGFKPVFGSEALSLAAYKSEVDESKIKSDYNEIMEFLTKLEKFIELSRNQ